MENRGMMDEELRKTGEVWKLNEEDRELAHTRMKVNKKMGGGGAGTKSKAQSHFSFGGHPFQNVTRHRYSLTAVTEVGVACLEVGKLRLNMPKCKKKEHATLTLTQHYHMLLQ